MSCDDVADEVVEQLQSLPDVTRAWASMGTTCYGGGGDVVEDPRLNVEVPTDITAERVMDVYEGVRAMYAAYVIPKVLAPEQFSIHVNGRAEITWNGYSPLDDVLAQEILAVTADDRFLELTFRTWQHEDPSIHTYSTPRDPIIAMYVNDLDITTADAMATHLEAVWVDTQALAATVGGEATLELVEGTKFGDHQTTGPNLASGGGGTFTVDVPATGQMPPEWGAIGLRTMDFAAQPELVTGEIHAFEVDPYARFVFEDGYHEVSDETQAILDDIVAQLAAVGYDLETIRTL